MDTSKQEEGSKPAPVKKAGPSKLPSKSISFANQSKGKGGKSANVRVDKSKKGGVNLMRKLSGM